MVNQTSLSRAICGYCCWSTSSFSSWHYWGVSWSPRRISLRPEVARADTWGVGLVHFLRRLTCYSWVSFRFLVCHTQ